MGKTKDKKKKATLAPILSLLFLIGGAAMMVKAFDVARLLKTDPEYVYLASLSLIIYGVFDLLILPLFEKGDNNHR